MQPLNGNGPTPSEPNSEANASTAVNRSHETRFKPGNSAARRHGLRAGTRKELRRRDARTSRLLGQYLAMRADLGKPIGPTQLPLARRYVELELRARDLYAALHDDPLNGRLHEMHISATRAQSALAGQLGESITTMRHLIEKPRSVLVEIAEAGARERRALLEASPDGD